MGISNYMIDPLMLLYSIFDMLLKFINLSFNSGTLPEALKIAKVIPIPKIRQPKKLERLSTDLHYTEYNTTARKNIS